MNPERETNARRDVIPAALSFLLPGLGQVYQGRPARGLSLFGAFTLLNLAPATRAFLVVPVAWSAWDAYRAGPTATAAAPARKLAFLSAGFVGFASWMTLSLTTLLPIGEQGILNAAADELAQRVRQCQGALGRYPQAIEECALGEAEWKRDPWGRPYGYRHAPERFEIRSSGRDGLWDTDDDYTYRYSTRP